MARSGSFAGPQTLYGQPVSVVKPPDNQTGGNAPDSALEQTIEQQLAEIDRLLAEYQALVSGT